MLKVTLEYKVSKTAKNVDWESVRSKYTDIWELMLTQLPSTPDAAKQLGKDYPHKKEDITKQVLTSKVKGIRLKYRRAVDCGGKSGHGRVALLYFELCEKIWGGSPATEQIAAGVETTDLGTTQNEGPLGVDTSHSSMEPQEQDRDVDVSNSREESSCVIQRPSFLDEKISNYKQEKLKRKLPVDEQLAQSAKDDLDGQRSVR